MSKACSKESSYDFVQHKHRFAAWCASTAAGASSKCRFRVAQGVALLDEIDLPYDVDLTAWNKSDGFDLWHSTKCFSLIDAASSLGVKGYTYGVAAKMLNCYVKAFWIGDESVLAVAHPPIDRLLLGRLGECDFAQSRRFWRAYMGKGWSNFSQADYLAVIEKIRQSCNGRAMWEIEKYWQGFQN